ELMQGSQASYLPDDMLNEVVNNDLSWSPSDLSAGFFDLIENVGFWKLTDAADKAQSSTLAKVSPLLSQQKAQLRSTGSLAGFGFTSGESPPLTLFLACSESGQER
ncbi:hypothetical protein FOZ63_007168, partial [Perkinsus olseni]